MTEEIAVAWAAGLFEGEGCITFDSRSPNHRRIRIKMTDRDVMQKFVDIVGYGKLGGPYMEGKPGTPRAKHKPYWSWGTGKRSEVLRILKMFVPYFGKRRSKKAIEAINKIEIINRC